MGGGTGQDNEAGEDAGAAEENGRRTRNNKEEGRVWDISYTMRQFVLIKKTSETRVGLALTKGYCKCCNMVIEVIFCVFRITREEEQKDVELSNVLFV